MLYRLVFLYLTCMGARRKLRRGGGQTQKRLPPCRKKYHKGTYIVIKAPYNEKNVAKRSPYGEKVAKKKP